VWLFYWVPILVPVGTISRLGCALFSCQSLVEAVLTTGADFLFVCKKDSHKTLYKFIEGAPLDERTVTERRPGKHSLYMNCLCLMDSL
jgi:hypothetical protein